MPTQVYSGILRILRYGMNGNGVDVIEGNRKSSWFAADHSPRELDLQLVILRMSSLQDKDSLDRRTRRELPVRTEQRS